MIGLDTNVLVRYLVRDDAQQAALATDLMETRCSKESPGFISHVVLVELCWVLGRGYGYARPEQVRVLQALLQVAELNVQQPPLVWAAIRAFEHGRADFSDYLIAEVNRAAGCNATRTLDRKAAQSPLHKLVD